MDEENNCNSTEISISKREPTMEIKKKSIIHTIYFGITYYPHQLNTSEGQTGRDIKKRIYEHKYCIRTCNEQSALYNHVLTNNHNIDFDKAKIVIKNSNFINRLLFESFLIFKIPNFNLSQGQRVLDHLSCGLLEWGLPYLSKHLLQ